ncbi:DUF6643 family protein, partial [Streptomyces sp. ISL-11]|uniref:DUF6643 family protein n=1 Tax=Streptomyces sp. ISL-11 TaxID=2819174 RepID=UPI001C17767C|nr:hypothetical protein [Streptomyces sp. ISL-11]
APQYGYPAGGQPQPAGLQQAPAPYIPQQAPRGYPGPQQQQQYQQQRPAPAGYDAMRPVAPRPAPTPYEDPYNRQYPQQGGY